MRSRAALLLGCALLVTLAGCGNHAKKVSATTPSVPAAVGSRRAPPAPAGVPKILLQVGTAYQNGSLVQFCRGSACESGPATAPQAIKASDPLLFIVEQPPKAATVSLTRGSAVADQRALHAGTMMVYAPQVKPGAYVVHLDVTWSDRRASWVFAVSVP